MCCRWRRPSTSRASSPGTRSERTARPGTCPWGVGGLPGGDAHVDHHADDGRRGGRDRPCPRLRRQRPFRSDRLRAQLRRAQRSWYSDVDRRHSRMRAARARTSLSRHRHRAMARHPARRLRDRSGFPAERALLLGDAGRQSDARCRDLDDPFPPPPPPPRRCATGGAPRSPRRRLAPLLLAPTRRIASRPSTRRMSVGIDITS